MIALNRPASYRAASDLAGYFRPSLERRLRGNPNMSAAGRISIPMQQRKMEDDVGFSRESARTQPTIRPAWRT